ncbi:MAG: High-affinity branched-chain amino acid transport ATP-binding protein LivF [Actinomycetota bacterium]|jgi:branched-chain amino acid transport system ATP-binding protein
MTVLLEADHLTCGYGKIVAVRDLDLQLVGGEVLAVLGPNGAGKSTLMMTLAGLLPRIAGDVKFEGKSLPSGKPTAANLSGVVLVPDNRALFTTLTVRENIEIARIKGRSNVDEVLDLFPALVRRLKLKAGALSGGEQQMLAMARGIVQQPKVFLIDEMSMGLAPIIVESLLPVVRRIADETNAAVVLVEQHVRLALEVADSVMVLVHGDVSLSGAVDEFRADPTRLEAAYLGASVA